MKLRLSLWWYVFVAAVFLVAALITHNTDSSFYVLGYLAIATYVLIAFLVVRRKRRERRAKKG